MLLLEDLLFDLGEAFVPSQAQGSEADGLSLQHRQPILHNVVRDLCASHKTNPIIVTEKKFVVKVNSILLLRRRTYQYVMYT
jgi:hypothetical protein